MYLEYFGLERNPFSLTPDPRFLFLTERHREALAILIFAVLERKGFLVLTGKAGTGKTTLIRKLLLSIPAASAHFSLVIHPTLTASELLETVLMDFGVREINASKAGRLSQLRELLLNADRAGKTCVLVIDEAHLLSPEAMEEIRLLSNFETTERKLLQIVLAGQEELSGVLNRESMAATRQRIALRIHLEPLSPGDVVHYLRARWARASGKEPTPFGGDAVEAVARFSRGLPRLINSLCDGALINACGRRTKQIGSKQIEEVAADLQLTPAAAAPAAIAVPKPSQPPAPVAAPEDVMMAFKTLQRYMPEKPNRRRWPRVIQWLRPAHTEVE
ncbi:MAG: ExeA family protein [Terriglobia bacterium]